MSRTTNTVPYTNAARAGRTRPGLIEMIAKTDPRSIHYRRRGPDNRAGRRARGLYRGATWSQDPGRRVRRTRRADR